MCVGLAVMRGQVWLAALTGTHRGCGSMSAAGRRCVVLQGSQVRERPIHSAAKKTPHVPLGVARGARWPRARTFRVRVETCLLSASSRQVCRTWLHFVHLWRHDGLIDARRAAIALRGFCARRPQAASSGKSAEGVRAQHPEPAMGSLRKVLAGQGAAPWCRTRPGCGQAG